MLRSRSVWFFTPSNPKLTFGGMEGEPKKEMYDLLPPDLFPRSCWIRPEHPWEEIRSRAAEAGIAYPFVVKPEVGGQGILLRKIHSEEQWRLYHQEAPIEYILQAWAPYSMEVSVFHIRHPLESRGRITGFLHKIPLEVVGNGHDTLLELIRAHPKASSRVESLREAHRESMDRILPPGEVYRLSHAANHNRGAQFVDLKQHIDESLVACFDRLSHQVGDFYYGRYDIMCRSVEDLKAGRHFTILEYNGCGAEPNHFYDTGYTLIGAYREILRHWSWLGRISRHNARQGHRPWSFIKGYRFLRDTRRLYQKLREADSRIPA